MTEGEFGEALVHRLRPRIPQDLQIETRRTLLYSLAFSDDGTLNLGQNAAGEPVRGGGTGFEQDIVIFRPAPGRETSVIPRVVIELKFGRVTTHDAIVYSEKARRIKVVYPFVRYGLVLGRHSRVPARVLRLGSEFDFIIAVGEEPSDPEEEHLVGLLLQEVDLSRRLGDVLSGAQPIRFLHRRLEMP